MDARSFYIYLQSKGFERRESQERMLELVEEIVSKGGVKLIEAPTGTGKTFAYLIPIITSGQKAIVSTGTKILQDQLRRDIEFLCAHYKVLTGRDVNYAVLKGKGNYLCIDRYRKENLSSIDAGDIEELIETDWNGDLTLSSVSPEVASKINVDEDYCTKAYREVCPYRKVCYYWEKVKSGENTAQILVVNHALLALREFEDTTEKILVIDEAHELDRYLTLASTFGISLYWLREFIGILGKFIEKNIDIPVDEFFVKNFSGMFGEDEDEVAIDSLAPYMDSFETTVVQPLKALYRETALRLETELSDFLESRLMVSYKLKSYLSHSIFLSREVVNKTKGGYEEPDEEERRFIEKLKRLELAYRKLGKLSRFVRLCREGSPELGYKLSRKWSRKMQTFNYRMEVFPIFPREVILAEDYKGVVLTSATVDPEDIKLTVGIEGDFHKLKKHFDYRHVNFIIRNTNPKREDWEECLKISYEELRLTHDKLLVLLTNKLHLTFFPSEEGVVKQGEGSLSNLIESMRSGKLNVLIGLDSLWTGVDIKGHKGLLIAKLPFENPNEPVTYHRIRYMRSTGEDSFEYQRRKAFIKFRQGIGRLVRQKGDGGTITLCDNRIWRYKEFIDFLKELGVNILYTKNPITRRTSGRPC